MKLRNLLCLVLILAMLPPLWAAASETAFADAYRETGEYLEGQAHTIGSEWVVLGLSRSGRAVSADYAQLLTAYVRENADENGRLHRTKATENARIILALAALGVDAMLTYYVEGGFCHVLGEERNAIATGQCYYALTAYARFLEGKNRLYDMTDVTEPQPDPKPSEPEASTPAPTEPVTNEPAADLPEEPESFPWWIVIVVGAVCIVVVVILRKKK